jgi:hypothetical protein
VLRAGAFDDGLGACAAGAGRAARRASRRSSRVEERRPPAAIAAQDVLHEWLLSEAALSFACVR